MLLDAWFGVALFLLGASCGALLTRIAYMGFKARLSEALAVESLARNETNVITSRTTASSHPSVSVGTPVITTLGSRLHTNGQIRKTLKHEFARVGTTVSTGYKELHFVG